MNNLTRKTEPRTPGLRRRKRTVAAVGIFFFLVFAAVFLAAIHVPSWYQPIQIPRADLQQVRDSALRHFNNFGDTLVRREPFNYTLDASTVTAWIAERDAVWPGAADWIPHWLHDPVVAFDDNQIILAARAEKNDWKAILSAKLSIEVRENELIIKLDSVSCGALSLPTSWTSSSIDRLASLADQDIDTLPDGLANAVEKLRDENAADYLRRGAVLNNEFEWKNGNRWFRIAAIHAENQQLTLQIVPL